jgi:UDP-N-acetylglucosamine 4-epimerase
MATGLDRITDGLRGESRRWLVTGVAGFIGSNLLQSLLEADQHVVGLDNFATGKRTNLDEVRSAVGPGHFARFRFIEGDVASPEICRTAVEGVDAVLHQAALGSVPRSVEEPLASNDANVTGHLALLEAARRAGVRRFVYASSSSVYGDSPTMPKVEDDLGRPLSPYAVTKLANELYATVYGHLHGMETVGLRYFNVFGPRQDPEGAYAAVVPKWIAAMLAGDEVRINGAGDISRDFCHVKNVVQANLLAATVETPDALNQAYNIAVGHRTTLDELFALLRDRLASRHPRLAGLKPVYGTFRSGDVMHSLADIGKARRLLGYEPTHSIERGLDESLDWYEKNLR